MKRRVWLTVFVLLFVCIASTAFAEQVVEVWSYPWTSLEAIAASPADGSVWAIERDRGSVVRLVPDLSGNLEVAVRVGPFARPYSITANSADGSCWVGDCCAHQVVHVAADGTELSRTGGFSRTQSVSVDSTDGSCWVADTSAYNVVHIAADGAVLSSTHAPYLAETIAAVPGTNSCWFGNTSTGELIHLEDNLDGSTTALSTTDGFADLGRISADSEDGTVWVSSCKQLGSQVIHLQDNLDGSTTIRSTTPMVTPGSLSAVSGAGVWVLERCGGGSWTQPYVRHLDADGNVDVTITNLRSPFAVSSDDADGSCWVLGDGDITHLTASGDTAQCETGFEEPVAVAANPNDGSSWVADCQQRLVLHVTAEGEVIPFDLGPGTPVAVAVDPVDGSVWVAECDTEPGQVIHLTADGEEIAPRADVCCPKSLAVDPNDGSCWVAEFGDVNCVTRLTAEDTSVAYQASIPYPYVVAVDPNDSSVWVGADTPVEGPQVIHFAEVPADDPFVISTTPVRVLPDWLVVDPGDSSCLASIGGGPEYDAFGGRASGDPSALDGSIYTVPIVRITDTDPEAPVVASLGAFQQPFAIAIDPADRSIWVADRDEVGHMAADGTVLSRSGGYCCVESVAVDTGDGSCWLGATEYGQLARLAVVPEAEFTASAESGVAPFVVTFTDLSTGSPRSWAWDFGDGGTSAEQNPTHSYGLGHYTVSLTVEGAAGSDTETKANYIYAGAIAPTANFSAAPTTGRAPLTVAFEDLSTNNPTQWLWSFGDGGTSDQQSPTHEYQDQGTYTVSLVVSNAQGMDVETKTDYIAAEQPLTAAFSSDVTRGPSPLAVQFTDESEVAATSWLWSFGDGGTSTAQNPSHTYEDPGFYTVTLTVGSGGASASVTENACIAVGFTDTPADHWALFQEIACSEAGIVQGYSDGSYDPGGVVNRAQMATYIARAMAGGDEHVPSGPATATFTDVGLDHWAYRYVEYCADHDIVTGYSDGSYQPEELVNRGQMAVFIARMVAAPTGLADYVPPTSPTFSDVTSSNEWAWCYPYVEYVAALDPPIVLGYSDGTYHPEYNVTRDQMAVYMQRALDLPIPGSTP